MRTPMTRPQDNSGGVRCACCGGGVREALREVANGEERRLKRWGLGLLKRFG
ncbi:hypothetical protein ERO13_A03G042800v2 [Gossypium hirsutum]|uniref:Uncharacterized protein n=3 Tax=Gossypium TaxID=3633 RepID=A0A5J5W9I5_GOSBA|nr:hypothetical protein ES319_A03G052300v1 [Gossypium barbadense]KAG4207047.1 hypothetical protein ERO13_A03G042800v2 [Gossypium hirsutum]TYH24003.1 hypothetical protein ES288_A03G057000v1 [Gossypium darwinii]TYH24016.1 hypothetical protein ES288_A03G058100v1 [Gossypium darwinii]TYI35188.1 hypothetical protein ES332_A03G058800v1 [Gossypium tomentosum]